MKQSRRTFLKATAAATAAGLAAVNLDNRAEAESATKKAAIPQRVLGRTGLKVSIISTGTGNCEENTLRYVIANGINFIHTSPWYSGGESIKKVGRAIKGQRDKVVLGLKAKWDAKSDAELNTCLRTLGTDHVDVIFFPIHNNVPAVKEEVRKEAFDRWKKAGKVRYMGLTTHGAMKACMQAAINTGWYDVVMPTYKLANRNNLMPVFKQCEKKNIGVVAMKTQIDSVSGDTIPVYMKDKWLSTINRTMVTLQEARGFIKKAGDITTGYNSDILKREYMAALGRCDMCGSCTGACPNSLAVNDIVRSVDYYVDSIHDMEMGRHNYTSIEDSANAMHCGDCGACEQACPNNVPVRNFVARSRQIFHA